MCDLYILNRSLNIYTKEQFDWFFKYSKILKRLKILTSQDITRRNLFINLFFEH